MCIRSLISALFAICLFMASPALPQGADVAFGGLKHDNSKPVEITADSLQLDQANNSATFLGNVLVGQDSLRMQASRIDVTYSSEAGKVSRMEAIGNVTLTNGLEAAEAGKATYDVGTGAIVMEGNVLLTQGANALSGEKLLIDLESGAARMEGRVKTIFQPVGNP